MSLGISSHHKSQEFCFALWYFWCIHILKAKEKILNSHVTYYRTLYVRSLLALWNGSVLTLHFMGTDKRKKFDKNVASATERVNRNTDVLLLTANTGTALLITAMTTIQ